MRPIMKSSVYVGQKKVMFAIWCAGQWMWTTYLQNRASPTNTRDCLAEVDSILVTAAQLNCLYLGLGNERWHPRQAGYVWCGGQKKRFSIHIKDTLKKCGIPPEQLEVLAFDRDTWRTTCNQGLTIFHSNYAADAESRRARRHTASTSSSGATCHIWLLLVAYPIKTAYWWLRRMAEHRILPF